MNTNYLDKAKTAFGVTLLISAVASALLGSLVAMHNEYAFLARVLLPTCFLGVGASVCGLAFVALAARGPWVFPRIGIVVTLAAAGLLSGGLWLEHVGQGVTLTANYWNRAGSLAIIAVAGAHLAALSLARLAPYFRWALGLAYILIPAATLIVVLLINGLFEAAWAITFLLVALHFIFVITILIPVCHVLSRQAASRCD